MPRLQYEMQKENTGSAGGWNSFAVIKRDVRTPKGRGTVDSVKLHFILDDRNAVGSNDGGHVFGGGIGTLWAAAYANSTETITLTQGGTESSQLNPDKVISIKASGSYGNVTLPINQQIVQDGFDGVEMDGEIYLWMKNTDVTTDDTLVWRIFLEVDGRWVKVDAL